MTGASEDHQPVFIIIAGSNGAGKTTLARSLRLPFPVVNADTIMLERGCSPIEAGRMALRQLMRHLERGESCVYETTLSGKGLLRHVQKAQKNGFACALHYVGLDNARMAVERVKARHASGQGHFVPPEDVVRRHARSHENLPHFMTQCDMAALYDNSRLDVPFREICRVEGTNLFMLAPDEEVPGWAWRAIAAWREIVAT